MRPNGTGLTLALALILAVSGPCPAPAHDPDATFAAGTWIAGVLVGGGADIKLQEFEPSDLSFVNLLPRVSLLPWEPFGRGWWKGALELGLEGWLQYYVQPKGEYALGLKAAARYHFIGLGRFVPYLEFLAGVGATDLAVKEIDSRWTFVLEGGAGLAYMVTDRLAVSAGARLYHVSNAETKQPNLGVNALEGVAGISWFFH